MVPRGDPGRFRGSSRTAIRWLCLRPPAPSMKPGLASSTSGNQPGQDDSQNFTEAYSFADLTICSPSSFTAFSIPCRCIPRVLWSTVSVSEVSLPWR